MEPKGLLVTALIIGLLLVALTIAQAMADDSIDNRPARRERPHRPPPEAYAACEGKQPGEAVRIRTPRGETIEAVCEKREGRLCARPANLPPPPPDQEQK